MSTATGRHQAGRLPGAVKVRLSGDKRELGALAALLTTHPAVEVVTGPDGPRRNRREPGYWVYLTVRPGRPHRRSAGLAHNRQSNPPAPLPHQGGSFMMTPDQLTDQLTRRLDGPHDDEHTAGAARMVGEAVRFLNYATGSHAPEGLRYPATVYAVAGNLSAAAYGLPQLCRQLASWLEAELVAGRLANDDRRLFPSAVVVSATARLAAAAGLAERLGYELAAVQLAISGLHTRGGAR